MADDKPKWKSDQFIRLNKTIVADMENGIENPYEIVILAVLILHADNKTGVCYPSIERIASLARISERSARSSIKRLEKAGYIEIEKMKNPKGQAKNIYRVLPR